MNILTLPDNISIQLSPRGGIVISCEQSHDLRMNDLHWQRNNHNQLLENDEVRQSIRRCLE